MSAVFSVWMPYNLKTGEIDMSQEPLLYEDETTEEWRALCDGWEWREFEVHPKNQLPETEVVQLRTRLSAVNSAFADVKLKETLLRAVLRDFSEVDLQYWLDLEECVCDSPHPIGSCLKCDLESIRDDFVKMKEILQ